MVCIDDFAIKKGRTYGTIMIDINTHRIIDMIESRNYKEVKKWLESYPNIIIVSRDGSITYHNAVSDALPKAEQVSDRFHLIKKLTTYIKDYLKKELQIKVLITSAKDVVDKGKELSKEGKSLMTTEHLHKTNAMIKHEENLARKKKIVKEVRKLKSRGLSNREISRRTGLHRDTVSKYLDEKFQFVHASYGTTKNGILTPYMCEIDNMLSKGSTTTLIESQIRKKGYSGSVSRLSQYISKWRNQNNQKTCANYSTSENNIELVNRKDIFKLLYHAPEKVKSITKDQFEIIKTEYPIFKTVYDILWDLKDIFNSQNIDDFKNWISKAQGLNIREINSFIEGIKRDVDAVKNAVIYPYSNGLAEGSINKLKIIKRTMYGRCNFETLKNKVLCLEKFRDIN
jgi:transposase